jgi:malate synthase
MAESAGIDVTGPKHERFDDVRTPEALDFGAALHREFDDYVDVLPLPASERGP